MLCFKPLLTASSLAVLFHASAISAEEPVEIIVISATNSAQNWLQSPASIDISWPEQSGLLFDSAQLLQGIPGLQADSRANFAQDTRLSVRGFGSRSPFGIRGIYLQQDGIPLSAPDGQGQLASVLLDNVQSLEVLRGPLAVLYGNGAGAVISLNSRQYSQNELTTRAALSEQHQQQQLNLALVSDQQSLQLAAKQFKTKGYRPHSRAAKDQLQFNWQRRLTDSLQFNLRYDWTYDPYLQDPLSLSPEQWRQDPRQTIAAATLFDTEKTVKQRQTSISLTDDGTNPFQLALWQGERDINQRLPFPGSAVTSAGGEVLLNRQYHGLKGQYQLTLHNNVNAVIGGSAVRTDDRRFGFINDFGQRGELRRDENNQASNIDGFIRLNYQASADINWHGGWRYTDLTYQITDYYIQGENPDDSGTRNYYQQAFAVGVNWQLSSQLAWFASAGKGFETPTLAELAYSPNGGGINLQLAASTNQQWETGLKWQNNQQRASFSLFNIDTDNEIIAQNSDGGRTSFANASKTSRVGLELQWHYQLSAQWRSELSGHILRAEFDDGVRAGMQLPGVAASELNWQWHFTPLLTVPLHVTLQSHYRSKVYTTDDNSDAAPAAIHFSASVHSQQRYQHWQFSQWLSLNNITDKAYVGAVVVNQANGRSFEPAAGREFAAGIAVSYRW
ncbi:iron complex outermembrane recepter protein [Arsukibacterium tuosuense]|uniref:Iron complex outermembrane recepter protein n=1 Tax=Arsukibacterium tuosuense TaxID=1323745 RepID=A0A285IRY7_9GAMM|nr:TonB-dependent receptor [Arsukibacterium tuosuense]SNY50785.1 iron complex outermembrane recepter protein [Arsukibacterium tuosuense]